ncbi:MAG: hypothetical protein HYR74_01070, partial [Candidatus Eisenbacteria bacterium]|nr:hypothetical protein [Candidatus Eisenbacteria bacterium]
MNQASRRFGIQALRSLGLRITELAEMSPQSVATIKRYTKTLIPELRLMVTGLTAVSSQHRDVLTDFWVQIIAETRQIAPPVPQRRFLDFFCPICLTRPSTNRHQPPVDQDDVEPETDSERQIAGAPPIRGVIPGNLEDAILEGTAACQAGANPCASSAARFAALVQLSSVRPWDAYHFITQNVAPDKWWIRTCIGCDRA